MKLIIDIPDHLYSVIKNKECTHRNVLTEAIYDGVPLNKMRAEIEEAKTVRVTANDATIEASADAVINPQYRNFTSGLDMAISIIDK